jgi:hypothetical protein
MTTPRTNPGPAVGGPELRIGDSEREAAVSALGEHYAAGRLTKEEFDERADAAWSARTRSALGPLFVDLPRPQGAQPVSRVARPTAPPPGPRRGHPGWRFGARMMPVLLLLVGLVVLAGLSPLLLVLLAFLFLARGCRHWSDAADTRHRGCGQRDWVR